MFLSHSQPQRFPIVCNFKRRKKGVKNVLKKRREQNSSVNSNNKKWHSHLNQYWILNYCRVAVLFSARFASQLALRNATELRMLYLFHCILHCSPYNTIIFCCCHVSQKNGQKNVSENISNIILMANGNLHSTYKTMQPQ